MNIIDIISKRYTFSDISSNSIVINMKSMLYKERAQAIEDDIVPVGFIGEDENSKYEREGGLVWESLPTNIY